MKNLTILMVFLAAHIAAALLPASVTIAALAVATIGGLIHRTRRRSSAPTPRKNALDAGATADEGRQSITDQGEESCPR